MEIAKKSLVTALLFGAVVSTNIFSMEHRETSGSSPQVKSLIEELRNLDEKNLDKNKLEKIKKLATEIFEKLGKKTEENVASKTGRNEGNWLKRVIKNGNTLFL